VDSILRLGKIATPEIDYNYILHILSDLSAPRDHITRLLKKGLLVRVKKGLYVLGADFGRSYSPFVLANLIYGPSYVSGHSALAHFGLIPERVEQVTSTCLTRSKRFETPVGIFTYHPLPLECYRVSVRREAIDEQRSFLIATPEKALVELMIESANPQSREEVEEWLDAMRIDWDVLLKFRVGALDQLRKVFKSEAIQILRGIITEARNHESSR
jgi:predicted transcriptional regulator of viral defense system